MRSFVSHSPPPPWLSLFWYFAVLSDFCSYLVPLEWNFERLIGALLKWSANVIKFISITSHESLIRPWQLIYFTYGPSQQSRQFSLFFGPFF